MAAIKSFPVLGDHVDILVTAEMSNGQSTMLLETSPPGGGPPPHRHENEDEAFFIVEGEYEILVDGEWVKGYPGDGFYRNRGTIHAFRNSGSGIGKILVVVQPGGFENYLEQLSSLAVPADLPKLVEISNRFGIFFPGISDNPALLETSSAVSDPA